MTTPRVKPVGQFERTYCECIACVRFCKTTPGDLAPGDVERIADYLGVACTTEFIQANFRPTSGYPVADDCVVGETVVVPTIVPAQRPDGRCVFLTSKDKCSIHPVAPFGCSQFNACQPLPHNNPRRRSLMQACFRNIQYIGQWIRLRMKDRGEA